MHALLHQAVLGHENVHRTQAAWSSKSHATLYMTLEICRVLREAHDAEFLTGVVNKGNGRAPSIRWSLFGMAL